MDRRSFLAALFAAGAVGSTASIISASDVLANTSVIKSLPEIDTVTGKLDEVDVEFAKGGNGKGWKGGNRGRHLGWDRGRRRRAPMYARRRPRGRRYNRRLY